MKPRNQYGGGRKYIPKNESRLKREFDLSIIGLLYYIPIIYLAFILIGCRESPQFELISPSSSNLSFANELIEDEFLNVLNFEYFYNGSGVGVGDFNKDGLEDLVFTSNMGQSRIYLNKGNFTFEDITEKSGIHTKGKWATGVSVIDINQDGFPDIYICFSGPYSSELRANELYINNGDNTFSEMASEYGLADTSFSVHAAFFDYDRDGFLDMYLLNNMTDETGPNVIRKKRLDSQMLNTDRLYRNNGDNTFSNVSSDAGITIEGYGLGVSIGDFNQDGWPDIYVSNDYLSNDLLYINQKDGTFKNEASKSFKHTSYSAMGNDVGDFNNDGRLDIITVDMLPPDNYRQKMMFGKTMHERYRSEILYGYEPQFMRNTLQWNQGLSSDSLPRFSDIAQLAGVSATDWSWSALWADMDNDGWKDLMVTNGYPKDITNRDFVDYKANLLRTQSGQRDLNKKLFESIIELEGAFLPNFLFHNQKDLTFSDVTSDWGFTPIAYSNGAAYVDLDNDGDLDLVIANTGAPAYLFKNNREKTGSANFLKIALRGPEHNIQGIGAKIHIYTTNLYQYHEHYLSRGYQSSVSEKVHFGLGTEAIVDSLVIIWPDQVKQVLTQVKPNQTLEIAYHHSGETSKASGYMEAHIVFEVKPDSLVGINFQHRETYFSDFNIQPLLPHKLSQNGPGVAVADINGDGLEDFFIGGAFNQSGEIYIQTGEGKFVKSILDEGNAYEEDMGALFFDADGDGDLDLYVVSGGNEFEPNSTYYQDRLYLNDGKGKFTLSRDALPKNPVSGSCVVAADFDQDGDLDLFVGGRLAPQQYPKSGTSQLLENQNGKFVDVTESKAPGLKEIGMVTAAIWSDFDNDGLVDLILVGEWMPITVFKNEGGLLKNITHELNLSHTRGWWNTIQGADLDNDGYTDYILGNLGTNSRYKTVDDAKLKIHYLDFDQNGTDEAIISYVNEGKRHSIHPRDDLFQQIPSLRKRFPTYDAYAKSTVDQLFPKEIWDKAATLAVDTFHSGYLKNIGGEAFSLDKLPNEAQISPIYGIVAEDLDGDGNLDLILSGNSYATEVLTGRYDASYGLVLRGKGDGGFAPLASNLLLENEAKGMVDVYNPRADRYYYLISNTDGALEIKSGTDEVPIPLFPGQTVDHALLHFKNGKIGKKEFYWGSGYLTQFGRKVRVSEQVVKIEFFDSSGSLLESFP